MIIRIHKSQFPVFFLTVLQGTIPFILGPLPWPVPPYGLPDAWSFSKWLSSDYCSPFFVPQFYCIPNAKCAAPSKVTTTLSVGKTSPEVDWRTKPVLLNNM